MTVRMHLFRNDGFGEYRNYYGVESLQENRESWTMYSPPQPLDLHGRKSQTILKADIVGLPEIVNSEWAYPSVPLKA